jgi:hypothetical protein
VRAQCLAVEAVAEEPTATSRPTLSRRMSHGTGPVVLVRQQRKAPSGLPLADTQKGTAHARWTVSGQSSAKLHSDRLERKSREEPTQVWSKNTGDDIDRLRGNRNRGAAHPAGSRCPRLCDSYVGNERKGWDTGDDLGDHRYLARDRHAQRVRWTVARGSAAVLNVRVMHRLRTEAIPSCPSTCCSRIACTGPSLSTPSASQRCCGCFSHHSEGF